MLLEGKTAIVYGGAGSIGSAVARGFAHEGATVHLAGRRLEPLENIAGLIEADGGRAVPVQLDALDQAAVAEHADQVAAQAGRLDISMNVISLGDVHGIPLWEIGLDDFERPIRTAVRSHLFTWRAAVRHMIRQRSGAILAFGGYGVPFHDYYFGGFQIALGAIDYMRRQLAAEAGRYGVRVVTLQSAGIPEALGNDPGTTKAIVERGMLQSPPSLDDVARVAAFAASDHARAITGNAINITCGAEVD